MMNSRANRLLRATVRFVVILSILSMVDAAAAMGKPVGAFKPTGLMKLGDAETGFVHSSGNAFVFGGSAIDKQGNVSKPRPNAVQAYNSRAGKWRLSGKTLSPRAGGVAIELSASKVLLVGGKGRKGRSTAELFNPATGRSKMTGSPSRVWPYGVGLRAFKASRSEVLIVEEQGYDTNRLQLYDARTERFSTIRRPCAKDARTVGQVREGNLLLLDQGKSTPAWTDTLVYMYQPFSGTCQRVANLRNAGWPTILDDNRVLFSTGSGPGSSRARITTKVLNVESGKVRTGGKLLLPRIFSYGPIVDSVTRLKDGRFLFKISDLSGCDYKVGSRCLAAIYDPDKSTFTRTARTLGNSYGGAMPLLLPNGKVLFYSEEAWFDREIRSDSFAEVFDPKAKPFPNLKPIIFFANNAVQRNRIASLRVEVKNIGDKPAVGARVCLAVPGSLVVANRCKRLGKIRVDRSRYMRFRLRIGRSLWRGKDASVRVYATAHRVAKRFSEPAWISLR